MKLTLTPTYIVTTVPGQGDLYNGTNQLENRCIEKYILVHISLERSEIYLFLLLSSIIHSPGLLELDILVDPTF